MQRQEVEAIGGPNLPPPTDCWTAQCVAASPGGPSHVMLDDRLAEHVPGCNMAFRRDLLLKLGGFDPQFRQAGDDVDICWRWMDAGYKIGYAASAVVWHHRRTSVRAFLRQQKGYGRSEAMLQFKHPERFNDLGCSLWRGVIYGEGAVGLPTAEPRIFHGRYGSGLFQTIYHRTEYSAWAYFTLLEWHAVAAMALLASLAYEPLGVLALAMWSATLAAAVRSTMLSPLDRAAPPWCRPLVFLLHLMQPVIRALHRYGYRLTNKRLPNLPATAGPLAPARLKRISGNVRDAYWSSRRGRGRHELLEAIESETRDVGWRGVFHEEWACWDVQLAGDRWHNVLIHTATEELGGPKRFTRARCRVQRTNFATVVCVVAMASAALVALRGWAPGMIASSVGLAALLVRLQLSKRACFASVAKLLGAAGRRAGINSFEALLADAVAQNHVGPLPMNLKNPVAVPPAPRQDDDETTWEHDAAATA
jgi:hypothetical protein